MYNRQCATKQTQKICSFHEIANYISTLGVINMHLSQFIIQFLSQSETIGNKQLNRQTELAHFTK
jgi:hypothetical protein